MRNRYLDLLRAAAIVRVIVYHLFGWPWLSLLLPAMGVMFALAGSLAAASLEKRPARKVVVSRLRRLLPPLWLLGLVMVPAMLVLGWAGERHGEHPFDAAHAWHLAFWILPLGDPPGSDKAADLWDPLWYIRAYVWFLLLSPLMWFAYRKVRWLAVAAPLIGIVVLDKTGLTLPDTADAAMWDFVTFGACWMAGFAHHDGRLRRIGPRTLVLIVLVLGLTALYWQNGHQGEDAWDLNDVPESQALWSIAFVLVALRWQPSMTWLPRFKPLDRLVTLLNARAVTIYLWHNTAITLVWPLLSLITLGGVSFDDIGHGLDGPVDLVAALLLTAVAVLAFGWVEDLAAKRRPRLWPTTAPTLRPVAVPAEEVVPALVGAYEIGGGVARPDLPDGPGHHSHLPGPRDGSDGPDLPDRPDLPDLPDRPAGHTSAAAAMHREEFRRTAPRSVPWAADLPPVDFGFGSGDSTGSFSLSPRHTSTLPLVSSNHTGALPIVGTGYSDHDSPAASSSPSTPPSTGRGDDEDDDRQPPGGGGADSAAGPDVAGGGRHATPPGDWPPARRPGRGGVPDWFQQRRGGLGNPHPE